jgi:hypothetical protein
MIIARQGTIIVAQPANICGKARENIRASPTSDYRQRAMDEIRRSVASGRPHDCRPTLPGVSPMTISLGEEPS